MNATTHTPTYDFTKLRNLLHAAGITIAEAARLFKVSRPTLYTWCDGKAPTQELLLINTQRLIKALEAGVAANELPLRTMSDRSTRVGEIVKVLRRHLT